MALALLLHFLNPGPYKYGTEAKNIKAKAALASDEQNIPGELSPTSVTPAMQGDISVSLGQEATGSPVDEPGDQARDNLNPLEGQGESSSLRKISDGAAAVDLSENVGDSAENGYTTDSTGVEDQLLANLKGKGKASDSELENLDDGDVEVQAQILDSFRGENQKLFAEFIWWKQARKAAAAENTTVHIVWTPSVKIEEVVDEEANPFQRDQVLKRQQSVGVSEIMSLVMVNRIAKLTDNETIESLSAQHGAQEHQAIHFLDPKSNIGRALNESAASRESMPGMGVLKMKMKPIRPEKCNREVSTHKFIQFVKAVRRYMIDRNVPPEQQVDIMTNDLEGIAYNFVE
ncbi:hypothetical protein V5O48_017064 [Marasmius crinis-equi]|uniref:Uncharacterized protein n=1 Tax=Marasmius crinis-equi TaxID=585013 RepID=A0ABR3EQ10_9AGAR